MDLGLAGMSGEQYTGTLNQQDSKDSYRFGRIF